MKLVLLVLTLCTAAFADITQDPDFIEIHGNGVYTTQQKTQAEKRLAAIEKDFRGGDKVAMAERANVALRAIFRIAVLNLKRHGYYADAYEVERGWRGIDGELVRLAKSGGRDIGDFEPWSQKLAILYLIVENRLGLKLCQVLRITDIATLLWTPPVVFHPCKYGRSEFLIHFADGDPRYGSFMPVVSYWVTNITCTIATFGAGYFFVCSPLSMAVEWSAEKVVAPRLGDFIYNKSCE